MTIKAEGKTYKSKPISVIVYERKDQFTTGTQGNPPESRYFIEASVDKPNPFRGEQITLTYTIYTKVDISGFDIKKITSLSGILDT